MSRKVWFIWIGYIFSITIIMIVIHEAAHVISALILGVPIGEITIELYGINPSVVLPERFINSNLTLYHWSGGITAGVSFLLLYFLFWLRRFQSKPSTMSSILGLSTIVFATFQFAHGYIEGRFHHAYIVLAGSINNPLNIIIYIAVIASFFIHLSLFPISKIRKKD